MSLIQQFRWLGAGLAMILTLAISFGAAAQQTSGNIGGDAAPGDDIQISNSETGFKRHVVANKSGKYRIGNVPTGAYQIIIMRNDTVVMSTTVNVLVGRTVRPPTPAMEKTTPEPAALPQGEPATTGQN